MNALKYNKLKRQREEKERYEAEKARIAAMTTEEKAEYIRQKEEEHKKIKELLSINALTSTIVDNIKGEI